MITKNLKNIFITAIILSLIIVVCYAGLTYLTYEFKKTLSESDSFKYNEFGDFIGGLLNPLFALISTCAVIFITYRISNNEAKRSKEALEVQKNITLTSLRHEALANLISKLNSYSSDLSKLNLTELKKESLAQKVVTNSKKDEKPSYIWLVIGLELENFNNLTYLFEDLINNEEYIEKYDSLVEIIGNLMNEENKMKMVFVESITKYIDEKQIIVSKIGEFILSQMDHK